MQHGLEKKTKAGGLATKGGHSRLHSNRRGWRERTEKGPFIFWTLFHFLDYKVFMLYADYKWNPYHASKKAYNKYF